MTAMMMVDGRKPASEAVIDALVADLAPVRPRRGWRDGLAVAALALVELALVLSMSRLRPDLAAAMHGPMFWWKTSSCVALALTGGTAAVLALDPAGAPRRWWLGLVAVGIVAAAVLLGTSMGMPRGIVERLDWREGVECLMMTLAYALPMALLLTLLARRAAPTRPRLVAWMAGLGSGGWGAFAFAWSCWQDDPLYVVVWYGGAVLVCAALARLVLVRAIRW